MDLGGKPVAVFFDITVPMLLPALVSGWLLSFTLSLDDLVISSFVSGPGATTLPMLIFAKVRLGVTPDINAITTIIIAMVILAVATAAVISGRRRPAAGHERRPEHQYTAQERLTSSRLRVAGRVYRDPDIYEQEIRAIFLKSWLYVGHQSQIPQTRRLFPVRDRRRVRDRRARRRRPDQRAAERVPAPRLANLRRSEGHESRLVCRYHGWTYGLDGSLRAATRTPGRVRQVTVRSAPAATQAVRGADFHQLRSRTRRPSSRSSRTWRRPWRRISSERARSPSPRKLSDRQQLEARGRELLRVLPLRCPRIRNIPFGHGRAIPREDRQHCWPEVMARAPERRASHSTIIRRSWLDAQALGVESRLRALSLAARSSDRQPRREAASHPFSEPSRATMAARSTCTWGR